MNHLHKHLLVSLLLAAASLPTLADEFTIQPVKDYAHDFSLQNGTTAQAWTDLATGDQILAYKALDQATGADFTVTFSAPAAVLSSSSLKYLTLAAKETMTITADRSITVTKCVIRLSGNKTAPAYTNADQLEDYSGPDASQSANSFTYEFPSGVPDLQFRMTQECNITRITLYYSLSEADDEEEEEEEEVQPVLEESPSVDLRSSIRDGSYQYTWSIPGTDPDKITVYCTIRPITEPYCEPTGDEVPDPDPDTAIAIPEGQEMLPGQTYIWPHGLALRFTTPTLLKARSLEQGKTLSPCTYIFDNGDLKTDVITTLLRETDYRSYDLQGHPVTRPARGLVITNGKKHLLP